MLGKYIKANVLVLKTIGLVLYDLKDVVTCLAKH